MVPKLSSRLKSAIVPMLIFISCMLIFSFNLNDVVSVDEALFMNDVHKMLQNQTLYTEIKQIADPVNHWMLYMVFRFFGEKLIFARLTLAILFATISLLCYSFLRKFEADKFSSAIISIWLSASQTPLFDWSHHQISTILTTISLLLLLLNLTESNSKNGVFAFAGILAGFSCMSHILKGSIFTATIICLLVLRFILDKKNRIIKFRQFGFFTLGIFISLTITALIIKFSCGFQVFFDETITKKIIYKKNSIFPWPYFQTSLYEHTLSQIFSSPKLTIIWIQQEVQYILVPLLLAITIINLAWGKVNNKANESLILLALGALSIMCGIMYMPVPIKMLTILPPIIILAGLIGLCSNSIFIENHPFRENKITKIVILLLAFCWIGKNLSSSTLDYLKYSETYSSQLGPVRIVDTDLIPPDFHVLQKNIASLKTRDILCYPDNSWLYILLDLNNPIPYHAMYGSNHTSADASLAINAMESKKVQYVIRKFKNINVLKSMENYLNQNFSTRVNLGNNFVLQQRKNSANPFPLWNETNNNSVRKTAILEN
jgi:hypothetical protein